MLQLSSGAAVTCTVVTDKTGSTLTLLGQNVMCQNIMCQSVNLASNLNLRSNVQRHQKPKGYLKICFNIGGVGLQTQKQL